MRVRSSSDFQCLIAIEHADTPLYPASVRHLLTDTFQRLDPHQAPWDSAHNLHATSFTHLKTIDTALLILFLMLSGCATMPDGTARWHLKPVSLYYSGYESGTEIVSVQQSSLRAVISNFETGEVDLLDIARPSKVRRLARFPLRLSAGEQLTSVDFHPSLDVFAAVVDAGIDRGRIEIRSASTGHLLDQRNVGFGPDSVVFSNDGRRALVANEGEDFWFDPATKRFFSAEGSISILHIDSEGRIESHKELALADVTNLHGFVILTEGRYLQREIDWNGDGVISAEIDFDGNGIIEPKKVNLGHFEDYAVFGTETRGEKSILIPIKRYSPALLEPEYIAISPDSTRAYVTLQEDNGVAIVDLAKEQIVTYYGLGVTAHHADSSSDKWVHFDQAMVGLREPDGIAMIAGGRYFVTADEGDTDSDPDDPDDPDTHTFSGGRSVSVFDAATGNFVGDTGNQLDEITFAYHVFPINRRGKKGAEPEMLVSFEMDGTAWVAVGLERAGSVALVSLADPAHPKVVALGKIPGDEDKSPEGIAHFQIDGKHYLITANEMSGTVACFEIVRLTDAKVDRSATPPELK